MELFVVEISSKPYTKNYVTKKTIVVKSDASLSLDLFELDHYGPKKEVLVFTLIVIDNFSKVGWKTPLKSKDAQTITEAFAQCTRCRKAKLHERDVAKEIVNKNLFLNAKNER